MRVVLKAKSTIKGLCYTSDDGVLVQDGVGLNYEALQNSLQNTKPV